MGKPSRTYLILLELFKSRPAVFQTPCDLSAFDPLLANVSIQGALRNAQAFGSVCVFEPMVFGPGRTVRLPI